MVRNSSIPDKRVHFLALDGVRAFAVTVVVLMHVHLVRGGFLGVDVFFVLSGFLITSILINEIGRSGTIDFGSFYRNRALRLFPALLICVAVTYVIASFNDSGTQAVAPSLVAIFYLMNWASAYGFVGDSYLGHTWSLAIEAQFYCIWPIVLVMLLRFAGRWQKIAISGAIVACLAWRVFLTWKYGAGSVDRTYRGLDTRCDSLLCGALLAILLRDGVRFGSRVLSLLCLSIVVIALLVVRPGTLWMHAWGLTLIAACSSCVIGYIVCHPTGIAGTILSWRPIVYIGQISYGIYLYHYPIARSLSGYPVAVEAPLTITLTLAAAALSYHTVERRMLALKRKTVAAHKYLGLAEANVREAN